MAHHRKAIRAALVSALTGLAITGSRVKADVTYSVAQGDLPCLRIMSGSERIATGAGPLERVLSYQVAAFAEGSSTEIQDRLDDILEDVEVALAADRTLGGTVVGHWLTSVEVSFEAGEQLIGVLLVTLEARYRTTRADPSTLV